MTTALYRITLWQTKKRRATLVRVVSEETPEGAVFLAQKWIQWSHAPGRGKRPKYDRYRVDIQQGRATWAPVCEGTLGDAEAQSPETEETEGITNPPGRSILGEQGTTVRINGKKSARGDRPKSRLTAMVEQMKQNR